MRSTFLGIFGSRERLLGSFPVLENSTGTREDKGTELGSTRGWGIFVRGIKTLTLQRLERVCLNLSQAVSGSAVNCRGPDSSLFRFGYVCCSIFILFNNDLKMGTSCIFKECQE